MNYKKRTVVIITVVIITTTMNSFVALAFVSGLIDSRAQKDWDCFDDTQEIVVYDETGTNLLYDFNGCLVDDPIEWGEIMEDGIYKIAEIKKTARNFGECTTFTYLACAGFNGVNADNESVITLDFVSTDAENNTTGLALIGLSLSVLVFLFATYFIYYVMSTR